MPFPFESPVHMSVGSLCVELLLIVTQGKVPSKSSLPLSLSVEGVAFSSTSFF